MDEVDGIHFSKKDHVNKHEIPIYGSFSQLSDGNDENANKLTTYYKLNHAKVGRAIIFNHKHFKGRLDREGTEIDCDSLKNCLTKLGFEIKIYIDLKKSDVLKKIIKASKKDYTNSDCLAIFILTHGGVGELEAKDQPYPTETLWMHFTDEKCKSLKGKPKLFFIQACQGDKYDDGFLLQNRTETDGEPARSYDWPHYPDMLIAVSTPPGYYAFRNTTYGSWFIQSLCEELQTNAYDLHILELLTNVARRVAINYESNPLGKKQAVCFHSTLTRLFKFVNKAEESTSIN